MQGTADTGSPISASTISHTIAKTSSVSGISSAAVRPASSASPFSALEMLKAGHGLSQGTPLLRTVRAGEYKIMSKYVRNHRANARRTLFEANTAPRDTVMKDSSNLPPTPPTEKGSMDGIHYHPSLRQTQMGGLDTTPITPTPFISKQPQPLCEDKEMQDAGGSLGPSFTLQPLPSKQPQSGIQKRQCNGTSFQIKPSTSGLSSTNAPVEKEGQMSEKQGSKGLRSQSHASKRQQLQPRPGAVSLLPSRDFRPNQLCSTTPARRLCSLLPQSVRQNRLTLAFLALAS